VTRRATYRKIVSILLEVSGQLSVVSFIATDGRQQVDITGMTYLNIEMLKIKIDSFFPFFCY
jgi:hypothetical protein